MDAGPRWHRGRWRTRQSRRQGRAAAPTRARRDRHLQPGTAWDRAAWPALILLGMRQAGNATGVSVRLSGWSGRGLGCGLGGCRLRGGLGGLGCGIAGRLGVGRRGRGGVGRFVVGGTGRSLGGVVVHIPAGAFELQSRRGERALKLAVALGTLCLGVGAEALDFFEMMAALRAAVLIQRQGAKPLRRGNSLFLLYWE